MMSSTTTNNNPLREQPPPSYESIVPNRSEGWPSEPLRDVEGAKPRDESRFITVPQATHAMRQELYITLVKAASNCRASLNDMEDLMLAGARILDTEITLLRVRGTITCLIGSRTAGWELKIKYRHAARDGTHSEDGLHTVHDTLNAVAAEAITIAEAIDGLNAVIEEQELDFPIRSPIIHLCVAAAMSIATYAILSHGSFRGADIPALGALLMSIAHIILYFHNPSNARILELLSTILTSLIVHDSRVSAVATTTLASALSGYLYMCNIVKHHSDSLTVTLAKIVFWSAYTILLGFGLPILLDLALMHKLLQLVIRVHDIFAKKGSRRLDTSNKVGRPVVEKSGALHV